MESGTVKRIMTNRLVLLSALTFLGLLVLTFSLSDHIIAFFAGMIGLRLIFFTLTGIFFFRLSLAFLFATTGPAAGAVSALSEKGGGTAVFLLHWAGCLVSVRVGMTCRMLYINLMLKHSPGERMLSEALKNVTFPAERLALFQWGFAALVLYFAAAWFIIRSRSRKG